MTTMLPTVDPESRSLAGVLPDCLASLTVGGGSLPRADHAVVVLVDGLGAANLRGAAAHARFLAPRLGPRSTTTSAFPSTTAAGIATLTTGSLPGRHGLVSYRARDVAGDRVVNQLSGWDAGMVPETWQRLPTVFERARAEGVTTTVIGQERYRNSGFTRAVLRGADYRAGRSMADRLDAAREIASTTAGPTLSYVYVPELDQAAHEYGWESGRWTALLEELDGDLKRWSSRLPASTGALITADHGVIDVAPHQHVLFDQVPELVAGVRHIGGEPRCLHLYLDADAGPADRERLAGAWRAEEGGRAWIATREQAVDHGWYGEVDPEVLPRIGDVIVAARKRIAYYDSRPADQSARDMIGQHGSLTDDERRIPLLGLGRYER
ncbi:alkaline phosphatase family protein [Plantibacter sp. VKM Ac-2876]|uniref:alkaline phosphatase family protein n=1 Tax=Plantibacter sp. VKM Ac-2876 TaxID=2783826 RepID=UPI001E6256AB|nr:alkaline phosphatase family protein [Plantibacter sp. VKM Ac-2876]